jgi:hypothetical protein
MPPLSLCFEQWDKEKSFSYAIYPSSQEQISVAVLYGAGSAMAPPMSSGNAKHIRNTLNSPLSFDLGDIVRNVSTARSYMTR